jgi:hypothetical protein
MPWFRIIAGPMLAIEIQLGRGRKVSFPSSSLLFPWDLDRDCA